MLYFIKLTIDNFGPYKGKQEIDFTSENSEDGITLIWGDNGFGKTTLLNIFRYALFGKVQGRGNKKYSLKDIANWESYDDGIYGFKVSLKMKYNEEIYEITRQFSTIEGISQPEKDNDYIEDVFLKKDTALTSSIEREHFINSVMPEQISRFFLFDGELLQEYEDLLSDNSGTVMKIKEAIERILGVPILTNGLIDAYSVEKKYSTNLSKIAQKNQNTQLLGNALESKQEELKYHDSEFESLKLKLNKLNIHKNSLEETLRQTEKSRELLFDRKEQENIVLRNKELLSEKILAMKEVTKNVWQDMLKHRILKILSGLDREIEILEDKKKQHIIYEQLMLHIKSAYDNGICPICKQQISESLKKTLKNETYLIDGFNQLSADEQNKIINLQGRRSKLLKLNISETEQKVNNIEAIISEITVNISSAEQRIKEINKNLAKIGDYGIAGTVQEDMRKCLNQIENTENGLNKEKIEIDRITSEIKNIEDKLKQQVNDAGLLNAEKQRDLCEKIKNIFEEGVDLYRNRLKQKVEKDASDIFLKISNQSEYTNLKINDNYGLSIVHRSGKMVEIRSAGYEHIVALSLIGALHKNAPLEGPIIMDSPFGRLDLEHKKKIIASLPYLAKQIILLVYKNEIDEQLARETLGGKLKNEYKLSSITAFHTKISKV